MLYDLQPLAITTVEWRVFIDVCQRVLGYSPTRGLDDARMAIEDPSAFLASLDMRNRPADALRQPGPHFGHYTVSFIGEVDDEVLIQLLAHTKLKVYSREANRREHLAILTGDMDEWHQSILFGCRQESPTEIRSLMNIALTRFEQAGFRIIFDRYKKRSLPDGTFYLQT